MFQSYSRLIGFFPSFLTISVTETSCKNPLCPILLKCSKRCSCKPASLLRYFLSLHLQWYLKQSAVLPIQYLRQVLSQVSCQKIYQTFVITVKAMVNFIWRMGYCTGKCFRFKIDWDIPENCYPCIYKILFSFPHWVNFSSNESSYLGYCGFETIP